MGLIKYLNSPSGLKELRKNAKHAVNQSSINQQDVKETAVVLPPLEEQHEIIGRVDALFKIADRIESRHKKARVHVDRITQSILAKAFRGELVPQNPNDEPASELLKRIQAERERTEKSKIQKPPKPYRKKRTAVQPSDQNRKPESVGEPERKERSPVRKKSRQ